MAGLAIRALLLLQDAQRPRISRKRRRQFREDAHELLHQEAGLTLVGDCGNRKCPFR